MAVGPFEHIEKAGPKETIEELLEVATLRQVPKNGQPAQWIVTSTPEVTQELVEHTVHYMAINNVFPGVIKNWKKASI